MRDGLLVVDKPAGWTSHDVVAKLRGACGQRRIGHAGTLDPDATGVLLVGLGRVTRLLRFLQETTKEYRGDVVFGIATDSLDASGTVVERVTMPVTREQVVDVAARFVGDIEQVPPMVSAVKVEGRRLHELARRGMEVEREPRRVRIEIGLGNGQAVQHANMRKRRARTVPAADLPGGIMGVGIAAQIFHQ